MNKQFYKDLHAEVSVESYVPSFSLSELSLAATVSNEGLLDGVKNAWSKLTNAILIHEDKVMDELDKVEALAKESPDGTFKRVAKDFNYITVNNFLEIIKSFAGSIERSPTRVGTTYDKDGYALYNGGVHFKSLLADIKKYAPHLNVLNDSKLGGSLGGGSPLLKNVHISYNVINSVRDMHAADVLRTVVVYKKSLTDLRVLINGLSPAISKVIAILEKADMNEEWRALFIHNQTHLLSFLIQVTDAHLEFLRRYCINHVRYCKVVNVSKEHHPVDGAVSELPQVPTHHPIFVNNALEQGPSSDDAPVGEMEIETVARLINELNSAPNDVVDLTNVVITQKVYDHVGEIQEQITETEGRLATGYESTLTLESFVEEIESASPEAPVTAERIAEMLTTVREIEMGKVEDGDGNETFAPTTLLVPSTEAFKFNPTLSTESFKESLKDGLQKVWEYLRSLYAYLAKKSREFAQWIKGIFGIRRKQIDNAKAEAKDMKENTPKETVDRLVKNTPLIFVDKIIIRNLSIGGNGGFSGNISHDLKRLHDNLIPVMQSSEESIIAWGGEIITAMKNVTDGIGHKSAVDVAAELAGWKQAFAATIAKHEESVIVDAGRHKGEYIGCIGIVPKGRPFVVSNPGNLAREVRTPTPNPDELTHILDAGGALENSVSALLTAYQNKSTVEVTNIHAAIEHVAKGKLSIDMSAIAYRKALIGELRRFQKNYQDAQSQSRSAAVRVQSILASLVGVTKACKVLYKREGVKYTYPG